MPTYYADDYEKLTGKPRPADDEVVAKVVTAPAPDKPTTGPKASTKHVAKK